MHDNQIRKIVPQAYEKDKSLFKLFHESINESSKICSAVNDKIVDIHYDMGLS